MHLQQLRAAQLESAVAREEKRRTDAGYYTLHFIAVVQSGALWEQATSRRTLRSFPALIQGARAFSVISGSQVGRRGSALPLLETKDVHRDWEQDSA